jgi:signal transduction histidine kinase
MHEPEVRTMLGTSETCGDHLITVINDILDLSKLESGKLRLEHRTSSGCLTVWMECLTVWVGCLTLSVTSRDHCRVIDG